MGFRNLKERDEGQLFVTEWAAHLRFTDQMIAKRLGVSRETVFRWRKDPGRLNPPKLSILARTLGIEPQDFWSDPDQPSLDYLLRRLPENRRSSILDILADLFAKKAIDSTSAPEVSPKMTSEPASALVNR